MAVPRRYFSTKWNASIIPFIRTQKRKSVQRKTHFHGNGILAGARPVSPSHHPLRCNLSFRHVFKVERECLGRENCFLLCIRNAVKRGITRGKQNLQTILQKLDRAAPNALDRSGHKKEFPNSFLCPEDRCSMHIELFSV